MYHFVVSFIANFYMNYDWKPGKGWYETFDKLGVYHIIDLSITILSHSISYLSSLCTNKDNTILTSLKREAISKPKLLEQ